MEYTELGAGSLEIILIILGAPGTYPRRVFPLFLRNFSHLWQPLQRRQSLEWLLEMLQEIETCTQHEGHELNMEHHSFRKGVESLGFGVSWLCHFLYSGFYDPGKLLHLLKTQFPHLCNGDSDDKCTYEV